MDLYNVKDAFLLLREYKITSHKESVRRWLRDGTIKGVPPQSRREGWLIQEEDLLSFIRSRMPEHMASAHSYTTSDARESDPEEVRAAMWWELATKNIFEGFIEPKKMQVRACINHKGYSRTFENDIWEMIATHTRGYASPRIPYLLDAFLFDGHRLMMDEHYEMLEERILYALIEYLRKK